MLERYSFVKTVPGTRGFHQFIHITESVIVEKKVSEAADYAFKFDFNSPLLDTVVVRISQIVVCIYEDFHWFGAAYIYI